MGQKVWVQLALHLVNIFIEFLAELDPTTIRPTNAILATNKETNATIII